MDERLNDTNHGTPPKGEAPEVMNGQENGRDDERERLLAQTYMEIEQMKAAAMAVSYTHLTLPTIA